MLDHRHKYILSRNQKLANQDLILVGCCISGKKWIDTLTIYLFWVVQVPSSNQTWPLARPSLQGICVCIYIYIYMYVHVDVCVCMHIYIYIYLRQPEALHPAVLASLAHHGHLQLKPCNPSHTKQNIQKTHTLPQHSRTMPIWNPEPIERIRTMPTVGACLLGFFQNQLKKKKNDQFKTVRIVSMVGVVIIFHMYGMCGMVRSKFVWYVWYVWHHWNVR